MPKDFSKLNANFEGVQWGELRKLTDPEFNDLHKELSDCYYGKTPFRTYGILNKEQFDKLHGLIFWKLEIAFHQANLAQPAEDRIPEKEYNEIFDKDGVVIGKKTDQTLIKIAALEAEGFEL